MLVQFNNSFNTIPLEEKIQSIFDINVAGQFATDGKYYCIHRNHKTHKYYALTREAEKQADDLGYTLEENQEAVFNGEKVRAMTFEEEKLWNEDRLYMVVDLWGNVAIEKEFDFDWYFN